MSFNIGDTVRITDSFVPGLQGAEAVVKEHSTDDFFGIPVITVELLTISDELQAAYEEIVPEHLRDEQPIEIMNFDSAQLELVAAA